MKQAPTPNSYTDNTELLKQLSQCYAHMGHRQVVLISGDLSWGWSLAYDYLKNASKTLLITSKTSVLQTLITEQSIHVAAVRPDKPSTMLGFDCSDAIIDCTEGFYPDALTSISGAIQPGGFLFIICPQLEKWPLSSDAFAKKRTSHGQTGTANSPNTIKRFIDHCHQGNALLIQQTDTENLSVKAQSEQAACFRTPEARLTELKHALKSSVKSKPWCLPTHTSKQQLEILNAIKQQPLSALSFEDQKQPHKTDSCPKQFHIIQADRGRGKSHLLGLIANHLLETNIDNGIKCYITAPNKTAIQSVFTAQQTSNSTLPLEFIAPERVLETVKAHDILLVDEAASLPIPILMAWSLHYEAIIFATTTHGYEGTGKGFQIRFLNHLKQLSANIHQHRLSQPIRYAENDPLESIMFSSFCLNAEPKGLELNKIAKNNTQTRCKELTRHDLIHTPSLLEDLFALLVQAHYQTRPSDLRDILDSPNIRIFALFITSDHIEYLTSACLISNEGNFSDKEDKLIENIVNGTRRPKGHLIPQVLTLHMGQKEALKLSGARVIRIATLPNVQNQNHGSQLLTHTTNVLIQNGYDYIGSSYADTHDVNSFWQKNDFIVIRTGNKLDKSSGTKSKLVLKALSDQGSKLVQGSARFYKNQSQTFQTYMDLHNTDKILINIFINETGSYEAVKDILERCTNWQVHFNKQFPKKASQEFRQIVSEWTKV